jgi:hypothetical protein
MPKKAAVSSRTMTQEDEAIKINDVVKIMSTRSPWYTMEGTVTKIYDASGWYSVHVQGKNVRYKRNSLIKVPKKTRLPTQHQPSKSNDDESNGSVHSRRIIIEDDDSVFIVREATSEDDKSTSTFEDDFENDDVFNAWRRQFQNNDNQSRNDRNNTKIPSTNTGATTATKPISSKGKKEKSHYRPTNQAMKNETDHLQLHERNQWLEKEVRRLNLLVEILAEELKSKANMDEA